MYSCPWAFAHVVSFIEMPSPPTCFPHLPVLGCLLLFDSSTLSSFGGGGHNLAP